MAETAIFDWLVRMHCIDNLVRCLPYVVDGRVRKREGTPYREAYDEIELYHGLLIVANGDTLADRLIDDEVVLKPNTRQEIESRFVSISDGEEFRQHHLAQNNNDGAYIYDGVNKRAAKVRTLNNNPKSLPKNIPIHTLVPVDFVAQSSRDIDLEDNIGNKTYLAALLPHAYQNTQTFQIKNSPYTQFGMGKVTHFTSKGLAQEFFLMYAPEHKGEFICPEKRIIGVHRVYTPENGRVVLCNERVIAPYQISHKKIERRQEDYLKLVVSS